MVFVDGSSWWKTKDGGIGAFLQCGKLEKRISIGYVNISVGQAELAAIHHALKACTNKKYNIHIYSDSQYCVNTFNKWLKDWKYTGFYGKKNIELIQAIDREIQKFSLVEFSWIRGHTGIDGNEIADRLATKGRKSNNKTDFNDYIKELSM